jgi:hypothetical protein
VRGAQIGGRSIALGCGGGASLNGNFNSRFMSRVELSATNGRFDVKRKHYAQLAAFVFKCQDTNVYQFFLAIVSNYLLVEAEE